MVPAPSHLHTALHVHKNMGPVLLVSFPNVLGEVETDLTKGRNLGGYFAQNLEILGFNSHNLEDVVI